MTNLVDIRSILKERPNQKSVPPKAADREVQKDVSYDSNVQYQTGQGAPFNIPGSNPDVYSVVRRPMGIARLLQLRPTVDTYPIYTYLYRLSDGGQQAEGSDVCAEPPGPGKVQSATLTSIFGQLLRRTDTIDMTKVGQMTNRSEPMDLRLVNQAMQNSPFIPEMVNDSRIITSDYAKQFYTLGAELEQELERMVFTGAGSSSGARTDFYGLDTLINTGKREALQNTLVPELDSNIIDWAGATYNSTVQVNGMSMNMVDLMSSLFYSLDTKSRQYGHASVAYVIVMHPDLFRELTSVWPCQYNSSGCVITDSAGQRLIVATGSEQVQFRDQMRQENFLMINGSRYPVVLSDGMTRTANASGAKSDIYVLPTAVDGNAVLYLEHYDYRNGALNEFNAITPAGEYYDSNNGLYLWTPEKTGYCIQWRVVTRPRLVLRTPYLATRITNVVYKTAFPTRSGFFSDLYPPQAGGLYDSSFPAYNTKIYRNSTNI